MKEYNLLREVVLLTILFAAAISDIRFHTIPNAITAAVLPLGLAFRILAPQKSNMYSAVVLLSVLTLLVFFRSWGKIGGGDVKIALCTAVLQPADTVLRMLFLSFAVNLAAGIFVFRGRKNRAYPLAPGMFLAALLELVVFGGLL